jgi:predicted aminopeptidase
MSGLGLGAAVLAAALAVCLGSGCSSLGYYGQALAGHASLLEAARPVEDWLADPLTPPRLRERLELSQQMRNFAVQALALPDNRSYRRYAALGRPAVVWNVVAAPELSLTLQTWCFPVLGCVGYRGYFDRAGADALARELAASGFEVDVYGVPAYSTLGWSEWLGGDPMLDTFLSWPESELARLIFHELAHQVVYVADDTTFNESYATAVERIGGRLWLARRGSPALRDEQAGFELRRQDWRALTLAHRQRLQSLYQSTLPDAEKRAAKATLREQLQQEYQALKAARWQGYSGWDAWFARANNASFAVQAAYFDLVPAFERLFEREGQDMRRFHAAVRQLAALPRAERRDRLAAIERGE